MENPLGDAAERRDKEAMDAIPLRREIACLLRTAEETAFARALAERERVDREGTSDPSDSRSGGPGVPAEARRWRRLLAPRGGNEPGCRRERRAHRRRAAGKKRFVKAERGGRRGHVSVCECVSIRAHGGSVLRNRARRRATRYKYNT